jgi:hypothetical protein
VRQAHVYVDVAELTYHDDARCPTIAARRALPLRRALLADAHLAACAHCSPPRTVVSRLLRGARRAAG